MAFVLTCDWLCDVITGPKEVKAAAQMLINHVDQDVVYYAKLALAQ